MLSKKSLQSQNLDDMARATDSSERIVSLRVRIERELRDVLDSSQRRRLEEIALQQAGPLVVTHPKLTTKLNIDPGQILLFEEIMNASSSLQTEERQRLVPPLSQPLPRIVGEITPEQKKTTDEFWKRARAIDHVDKKVEDRLIAEVYKVLRLKQLQIYRKLRGKPFDLYRLTSTFTYEESQEKSKPVESIMSQVAESPD